jgi:hypothetical protein
MLQVPWRPGPRAIYAAPQDTQRRERQEDDEGGSARGERERGGGARVRDDDAIFAATELCR